MDNETKQQFAQVRRKTRSVDDHTIVAVAFVPCNMPRWDRVLYEIETHLTAALVHVLKHSLNQDWAYFNTLEARHCSFSESTVVHSEAPHTVTYRYVVIKGPVPFNISFEEAQNANDRNTNFSRVFTCG